MIPDSQPNLSRAEKNKYDKNTSGEKHMVRPYYGRHHTVLLNNIDK